MGLGPRVLPEPVSRFPQPQELGLETVDTVDTADIVHTDDTLDIVESVNSVDNVSSVSSVHSVLNVAFNVVFNVPRYALRDFQALSMRRPF